MTDIVERLRAWTKWPTVPVDGPTLLEAADEIERQRVRIDNLLIEHERISNQLWKLLQREST